MKKLFEEVWIILELELQFNKNWKKIQSFHQSQNR